MSIEQTELTKFLDEHNIDAEIYNDIVDKIDFNLLEDYLGYKKLYNIKPEDYKRIRKKYNALTNLPDNLDLDLYIRHNRDRSYQSNMFLMSDLTKLIKSVESTEDLEKEFYESKTTLKEIVSTNTLTKFRKAIKT